MKDDLMPAPRQSFRSQYGRKGISVPASCPTRALRWKLNRMHVSTSDADVEAMVREAVAEQRAAGNAGWTAAAEKSALRFALWQHAENRAAYGYVTGGSR